MAPKLMVIAFSLVVAASPVLAANQEVDETAGAPAAGADAKYCMRVESVTGTRVETVQCWTRAEWAALEVDVDAEWAKEGVRVIT